MWGWIKAVAISAWALILPIHAVMYATGALVILDTISGIWASIKRGEAVTSAKLRRTVSKTLIYLAAILSGFLCQQYMTGDLVPISKLVASAIGLVELTSILENVNAINGSPIFDSLIKLLGSKNDDLLK